MNEMRALILWEDRDNFAVLVIPGIRWEYILAHHWTLPQLEACDPI